MKRLVCNFKTAIDDESLEYTLEKLMAVDKGVELILAPPFPYLDFVPKRYKRCSQDISIYNDDISVGETTANILKAINVSYTLVGHSIRRTRFAETEIDFIKKINNANSVGITPIYCIGETREEKLRNKTFIVLERQIARVLNQIDNLDNIILAYEPRWAISCEHNGLDNVNVMEISEIIIFIKKLVKDYYGIDIEVIYGGSVNSVNIDQYRNLQSDGLLIGQASLDSDSIKRIAAKMYK